MFSPFASLTTISCCASWELSAWWLWIVYRPFSADRSKESVFLLLWPLSRTGHRQSGAGLAGAWVQYPTFCTLYGFLNDRTAKPAYRPKRATNKINNLRGINRSCESESHSLRRGDKRILIHRFAIGGQPPVMDKLVKDHAQNRGADFDLEPTGNTFYQSSAICGNSNVCKPSACQSAKETIPLITVSTGLSATKRRHPSQRSNPVFCAVLQCGREREDLKVFPALQAELDQQNDRVVGF